MAAQILVFRRMADQQDLNTLNFLRDANFRSTGGESGGGQKDLVTGLLDSCPAKDVTANEAFLALQRELFGPDHPSVAETLEWLAARHEAARGLRCRATHDRKRTTCADGFWVKATGLSPMPGSR